MDDILIIGGGVIGLSLAYELSQHGLRVRVVDRATPGQESSWAGAGILAPAVQRPNDHPLEQLAGLSHALHAQWARKLRQTGVDTGYLRCGGLYLAHDEPSAVLLERMTRECVQRGVEAQWLSPAGVRELEPAVNCQSLHGACLLPGECQLRNPRHVKALLLACLHQGVAIQAGMPVDDFTIKSGWMIAARASGQELMAHKFCITGGAWTRGLLERLGLRPRIKPIRGQIVLLSGHERVLRHVINEGHRYLVPRADGRILIGSTEEDVGFDKRTTAQAIGDLLQFGVELVPALKDHQVERTWAGLRPGSGDGFPYLGPLPGLSNAFVAAGHYRQGLHLSPGTAVVMSELIRGQTPQIDLTPFRVDRD